MKKVVLKTIYVIVCVLIVVFTAIDLFVFRG